MPALQVRDFPEELYEKLRQDAQREHRSISQQAIVAVSEYLTWQEESRSPASALFRDVDDAERSKRLDRRRKVFEQIDALPIIELAKDFPSPEQMIRELRDSR